MWAKHGCLRQFSWLIAAIFAVVVFGQRSTAAADPQETSDAAMKVLLAKLKEQESLFRHYTASVKTIRQFGKPTSAGSDARVTGSAGGSDVTSIVGLSQQTVQGQNFRLIGEDITTWSSETSISGKRQVVCDGRQTIAIEEKNCVTVYAGRAEPPQLIPPHCWGIFHLGVSFPLSVYLEGTEAMASHPKVGRHPLEGGSVFEFNKVGSQIVDEDRVDDLDCFVVLVKRWYYSSDPPFHQYLWLAKDRNLHVIQTRTAQLRDGKETPREESRVKRWVELSKDVWVPELVEVTEISAEAFAQKTLASVVQRLTVLSTELNPELPGDSFQMPPIPAELPRFELDAAGHLIGSPFHPVAADPVRSTTLEAILDRLTEEEKKYEPCELVTNECYSFLNLQEGMSNLVLNSQRRRRTVLFKDRQYVEDLYSSLSAGGKSESVSRQGDDGKVQRFVGSATNQGSTQHHASIGPSRSMVNHTRDDLTLSMPRTWATRLKSGSADQPKKSTLNVEYVCDERVGERLCHKLKCVENINYFYLWLARDRNLWPIRHEWHEPRWNTSLPTSVAIAEDFREVRPGTWLPYHATNYAFQKSSRDGLNVNRIVLQWRQETNVELFKSDPVVDDRLFSEFEVPEGAQVTVLNEQRGVIASYKQAAAGRLEYSAENPSQQNGSAKTSPPSRPRSSDEELAKRPVRRKRGETPTARLLDRLERQNSSENDQFTESWLLTIKRLVDLGPDAVPELIEELDATNNPMMLRCLGFITRAIGDQRAVPALIRAIPKTLVKPGSDMGLNAADPDLFKFAKANQLIPDDDTSHYSFGRPVREICGALSQLTGKKLNEETVYRVFLNGPPMNRYTARRKYYDVAKAWADWWNQNGAEIIGAASFQEVELQSRDVVFAPVPDAFVETDLERTGMILQSVLDPESTKVFFDIETERVAALPDEWRTSGDIASHLAEILAWAQQEGFDLMGTDYNPPQGGKPICVLQGIGLRASELDLKQWHQQRDLVTLEMLRKDGRMIAGLLTRRDPNKASEVIEPEATASFFATTSERRPVLIHIGVETQTVRRKPGTFYTGNPELDPIADIKGRRFCVMYQEVYHQ